MKLNVAADPITLAKSGPRLFLAALLIGQSSMSLVFTAYMAALPQMANDFGPRGPFIAKMTMAMASLGLMFGSVVSGWVLEKLGTRSTMLVSLFGFAAAGTGGIFLRTAPLLFGSRFIVGFSSACMATACFWCMAKEYDEARRARTLGFSAAISNVLGLATVLLGGYITQSIGWQATFLQYPAFGAIGLMLVVMALKQTKPRSQQNDGTSRPFFARLLPFYLLTAVLFAVMFISSAQFAFVMSEDGVRSPETRSYIMATVTIIGALGSFSYGWVESRLSATGAFALALLCETVSMAAIGFGRGITFLVIGGLFMGLYIGFFSPYMYQLISEVTDEFTRSRAIGLLTASGYLGAFLNPVIFAPLSDAIGLHSFFLAIGVVTFALFLGAVFKIMRRRSSASSIRPALNQ
jgi:MFS family permease